MESSHFLAICSPWQKLQNVVLLILICCHGNEIWATFAKISNCFFFVYRWNRAIFWPLVLRDPSTKPCSSIFDLGPITPKIDFPKFGKKIAYNSACMAERPQMFAPNRGFSGMADWMEPYKMLSGRPLLPWQRKFDKFGLLFHKNRLFFFASWWNRAIFGPSVLHVALYKTFLIRFFI